MVESGSAGGGGSGTQAPARAGAPPRPTLILPPRSSMGSLFQGGGGAGGGAAEASPGPLTLVSSFFAEDPESDCGSFSQLLAGAMYSPVAAAPEATTRWSAGWQVKEGPGGGAGAEVGGGGRARLGQNRPPTLEVSQPQLFTVPPGLSPTSLLDSPAFFSSGLGNFGMSHQEALAQVTAQAAFSPFRVPSQMEFPSPLFSATTTTLAQQPTQDIPTSQPNNTKFESAEESKSDQISQPAGIIADKPADDGYNWRKYGQKMVKGCEYPRSYYKCTHPNCPVKKKLERSEDGQVTEIIYKGQHNHPRPTPNKRSKEGGNAFGESNDINGNHDISISEKGPGHHGNLKVTNHTASAAAISQTDQGSGYGILEQLSGSSDNEDVAEVKADEGLESEPDHKRRNISVSSQRTLTEPRIVVQTTSEVDLLDDGYRWRKYGQKVVKGNPNPRSYYKCTFSGCNVRKHIERSSTDLKAVITTYEGKHNHDVPAARNSSHNIAGAVLAPIAVRPNQTSLRHANFNNNESRPVGVLQLKEEHEIT